MKRTMLALAGALLSAAMVYAEYYSVTVTRKDQDLDKVEYQSPPVFVVTRWCYEYEYFDDAVLKYEPYSYDNKLIFSSGESCDVVKVVRGGTR